MMSPPWEIFYRLDGRLYLNRIPSSTLLMASAPRPLVVRQRAPHLQSDATPTSSSLRARLDRASIDLFLSFLHQYSVFSHGSVGTANFSLDGPLPKQWEEFLLEAEISVLKNPKPALAASSPTKLRPGQPYCFMISSNLAMFFLSISSCFLTMAMSSFNCRSGAQRRPLRDFELHLAPVPLVLFSHSHQLISTLYS